MPPKKPRCVGKHAQRETGKPRLVLSVVRQPYKLPLIRRDERRQGGVQPASHFGHDTRFVWRDADSFEDSLAVLIASQWNDTLGNAPTRADDSLLLDALVGQIAQGPAGAVDVSAVRPVMESIAASYGHCPHCVELVAPFTAFAVETAEYWESELDEWGDDQCDGGDGELVVFSRISAILDGCPPLQVRLLRRAVTWQDVGMHDVAGAIGISKDDLRGFMNYFNSRYWERKALDELKSGGNWLPSMIRLEAPPGAGPKVIARYGGLLLRRMHVGMAIVGAGTASAHAALM